MDIKSAGWDQFQQELADLFSREDNFELLEEGDESVV